jgi:hypothetical protein
MAGAGMGPVQEAAQPGAEGHQVLLVLAGQLLHIPHPGVAGVITVSGSRAGMAGLGRCGMSR